MNRRHHLTQDTCSQAHSKWAGQSLSSPRSGVVTFWALVTIPIFLIMLCIVFEVGNLWAGRIQLKNALESAALAGVKSWGDGGGGNTNAARDVAITYAGANVVNGAPVAIDANYNNASPNQNADCAGNLIFGVITSSPASGYVFNATASNGCVSPPDPPNPPPYNLPFAVRAQATMEVPSICNSLFGVPIGPFNVTAKADALYECLSGQLRVYHVDDGNFTCP